MHCAAPNLHPFYKINSALSCGQKIECHAMQQRAHESITSAQVATGASSATGVSVSQTSQGRAGVSADFSMISVMLAHEVLSVHVIGHSA